MSDIFAAVEQLLSILKACPQGQAFFVISYQLSVSIKDMSNSLILLSSIFRSYYSSYYDKYYP
jgi:hypothetical protein